MKRFTFFLMSIMLSFYANSTDCDNLRMTANSYPETVNLIDALQAEFGNGYTIADWTDLQAIPNINTWITCMGIPDGQSFMLTKNGDYFYSGNRQYFVKYSTTGVPGSFLIHDQIGSLYLGSWYDINIPILAKNVCSPVECTGLKLTCDSYPETVNLIDALQAEFGNGYTIADWTDLQAIPNINTWITCMGIPDGQSFMLTKNGDYFYSGNRQYFVKYSTTGVPGSFLIHDQIGSLYLGSWYDINIPILAKNVCSPVECTGLKLTCDSYPETVNLIDALQAEFGNGYTIADWTDLQAIPNINTWITCMGIPDGQSFMLTKNGDYFYSGNRQYFVKYSTTGVPGSFLIHDQIGSLYLGSWYDINIPILAKNTNTASTLDLLKAIEINIYPNPANDKIEIEGLQAGQIEIINLQGQVIKNINMTRERTTIDISKLSSGVYSVRIKTDDGIIVKKLIKQ